MKKSPHDNCEGILFAGVQGSAIALSGERTKRGSQFSSNFVDTRP